MTQGAQLLDQQYARVMPAVVAGGGTFSSFCNILAPDGLFDSAGAPSGNYAPVSGLQGIVCQKAALSVLRIGGTEQKSTPEQEAIQPWHCLLDTYYPALDGHTEYRAQVDGVNYDVLAVEHDSQKIMTRLSLRIVKL